MELAPSQSEIDARFRAVNLRSAQPRVSDTIDLRVAGVHVRLGIDVAWKSDIAPLLRTYWSPFVSNEASEGVELTLSPADGEMIEAIHPIWNSPDPFLWKVEDATGTWVFHRDFICQARGRKFHVWMPRPTTQATDGLDNILAYSIRNLTEKRQTFLFHAAAVEHKGHAVVLFGPSGIGKSTVARYSREWGFRVMASDQVYLRLSDSGDKLWAEASPTMNPDIPRCPLKWATEPLEVKALLALKRTGQFEIHGVDRPEFARLFFAEIFNDELESASARDFSPALDFTSRAVLLKGVTRARLSYPAGMNFWPLLEELEYV